MNTNTEGRGDFSLDLRIQEQGVLCCDGEKLVSELHQLCQLLQFLWEATPWHQDQIRLLAACFTVTACILAQIHQSCTCWQFSTAIHPQWVVPRPCFKTFQHQDRGNVTLLHFCDYVVHIPQDLPPGAGKEPTSTGQLELGLLQEIPPPFWLFCLQYDFFAPGLGSTWFLSDPRITFSHCSLSSPLRFHLTFAFSSYLRNRFIFLTVICKEISLQTCQPADSWSRTYLRNKSQRDEKQCCLWGYESSCLGSSAAWSTVLLFIADFVDHLSQQAELDASPLIEEGPILVGGQLIHFLLTSRRAVV